MPISPGLSPLYAAKAKVARAIVLNAAGPDDCKRLWAAVIEQAIFDAHVHTTGGTYPAVAWVRDARQYFETDDFSFLCELLNIDEGWVRSMVREVEQIARTLRGDEYERAAIEVRTESTSKYAACPLPIFRPQLEFAL